MLKARLHIILFLSLLVQLTFAQQNHLQKKISLSIPNWTLGRVLNAIENQAGFFFSYDSEIIPEDSLISVRVQDQLVSDVLNQVLPTDVEYKTVGNHVVIFKPANAIREVTISGYIRDSRSMKPLAYATLYDPLRNKMATTDAKGHYEMMIASTDQKLGLTLSKSGYRQEVVYVEAVSSEDLDFELLTLEKPVSGIAAKKLDYPDVNDRKIVRFMVPDKVIENSNNLTLFERVPAQFSIIPGLSTNGLLNGSSTNNFSLNLLAGYSKGTDGVELGGLVNINREDMKGLQMAGVANYTGRFMKGMQIAGMLNYNGFLFEGVQLGGMANLSMGDMAGLQMSGFSNVLRGQMSGFQVTGFTNFTSESVDGLQMAGFLNITAKDVNLGQISGFANYSRSIKGIQASGFLNFALEEVKAAQISGFLNFAPVTEGLQAAGYTNISITRNSGWQLASFFNYARNNEGVQLAMFNYADTSSGVPFGLLSIVPKGYHTLELSATETFTANLSFKTGVSRFYNILEAGFGPEDFHLSYGLGTRPALGKKWNLGIDLTGGFVFDLQNPSVDEQRGFFRLTPTLNYQPFKGFGIAAGPSLNYYFTDQLVEGAYRPLSDYAFYSSTANGFFEQAWIGWRFALRFF